MTLTGWGAGGAPLGASALRLAVVGTAPAFARAASGFKSVGSVLIGRGEAIEPVLARVTSLRTVDCKKIAAKADALVLLEAPHDRADARALLEHATARGLRIFVADAARLRPLTLDDLVGAAPWHADDTLLRSFCAGKRILITGGGGTIGSALARRIASFGPERLTLFDASEANLFALGQELPNAQLMLADVRDGASVARLFAREKPSFVFHAAALKQVPLVEAHASQGVLTNVAGARHVAEAARGVGADMLYVSTDKAVNPQGVMGASKRVAELYCQAMDRERRGSRVLTARLVNVLGSTGSVAPLFAQQLARGGPLTITDAAMSRYFVTIEQAGEFLLTCAALGSADANVRGAVFAPAMAHPTPVIEIARDTILLAGLQPEKDVAIKIVGLRPGEKLREQLVGADERRGADLADGVMAASSAAHGLAEMNELVERLALMARAGADAELAEALLAAAAPATVELTSERA